MKTGGWQRSLTVLEIVLLSRYSCDKSYSSRILLSMEGQNDVFSPNSPVILLFATPAHSLQIREQFTGSLIGQQLVLDQIYPNRCDVSSLLEGGLHIMRERRLRERRAVRTAFALGLLFYHHGSLDRQMDHLAAFLLQALHLFLRPPDTAHSV
jgi:hypothetical protein